MPTPPRNFESRTLYHGDNLPFLRGMNSGTVDLIATDPPFNKSKDFHATPDSIASGARFVDRWSWDRDVHEEWVDAIEDDWPAAWSAIDNARTVAGEDMGAFLCWLGVRLMEMHRVLADHGSIYLHIDHTAHAYVKTLMDAIFGRKNFRNEIVWCYGSPGKPSKWFPRKHDTILFYAKSDDSVFDGNAVLVPHKRIDPRLKKFGHAGEYAADTPIETLQAGKMPFDWWTDFAEAYKVHSERTGYPTQKPLRLYERIIKASSNEGDLVLDPFCGCATTPVAAERSGREWVGMDIWDGAHKMVLDRLRDEKLAVPDAESGASPSLITFGSVIYSTTPPVRTDEGKTAAPTLNVKVQIPEPPGPKMTNAQMKAQLIERSGIACAGCDRRFDDERYLQLDHNAPRSQGGLHHISNRLLLCGPCNLAKSNTLTLEGLRRHNRANGWMAKA